MHPAAAVVATTRPRAWNSRRCIGTSMADADPAKRLKGRCRGPRLPP
jgi:hypothetical protein